MQAAVVAACICLYDNEKETVTKRSVLKTTFVRFSDDHRSFNRKEKYINEEYRVYL